MSAVLASRLDPGTITVLKGNRPLCLRIHRQDRVVRLDSGLWFVDCGLEKNRSSGCGAFRNHQPIFRNFLERAVFMEATTMERISFASFIRSVKRFAFIIPASVINSIQ